MFAEIALVIVDEESPAVKDWMTWRDVLHLVDLICCAAVLFPIVWSIKHLREASQTDGKVCRWQCACSCTWYNTGCTAAQNELGRAAGAPPCVVKPCSSGAAFDGCVGAIERGGMLRDAEDMPAG